MLQAPDGIVGLRGRALIRVSRVLQVLFTK